MTKQEKLVVSAYTGILMCNFEDVQAYAEDKLGRPILTHEFADDIFWKDLKKAVRQDFLKICKEDK